MASNLKRSKRTVGRRLVDLQTKVSGLQKRVGPIGLGANAVSTASLQPGAVGGWIVDSNAIYSGTKSASGSYASTGSITIGSSPNGYISANKFRIDANGDAFFTGSITGATGTFSGSLSGATITGATGTFSGSLSGATITGGTITIGSGSTIFKADSQGIYLGNASFGSAPFSVSAAGTLIASGATIANGVITNGTNFKVDTNGNVFANNIYATGSAGGTQPGLIIRSDGVGGEPASAGGSLYLFSATGTLTTSSSQYKVRIGSSSRYLEISYPRNPNTTGGREHVNVETTQAGQHLRLSSSTGQLGLLGNTQTQRTQDAVTVAGDIILENYGPAVTAIGGNGGDTRTVYSKNIGASSSTTTCRIGVFNGLEFYGSPSSLRELKENIEDISGIEAINIVKSLRPRKFTWKPTDEDTELGAALKKLDLHYGFVAEEIQEAQPRLATYKMTTEFQDSWPNVTDAMFNEFPLIFYKDAEIPSIAISAIKNLIERVEYLESRN